MEDMKDLLDDVIREEIQILTSLQSADEKSSVIDCIVKLYKLRIEETKNESDSIEKFDARENEQLLKKEQFDHDKKMALIKIGLETMGIVLPLIFYGMWMKRGLKFEETGTFTSTTFRNLFGKFRPTK